MDNTERDGLVLRLQGEISKLKEVFQYSSDSQNWAKSEKVCRCTDEEFNDLMQTLSANELEAATLILQRHIDLEQQITKCLENLKGVQSGDDKKSIDVTQKLITSQSKIARLRSRLLRCVTQQLQKKGSLACQLPPWSGPQTNDSGRLDHEENEMKAVEMNDSGGLDHEEKERKAVEINDSGRLDREENESKAVEMNDSGRLDREEKERKAVDMNDSGRLEEKEMKAVLPLEQNDQVDGEQDACSVDPGLNGEKTEDNSPVYETIYPTVSVVKGQMSTGGDLQANASSSVQEAEGEQAGTNAGCSSTSENMEDNSTNDVSIQEPSTKADTNTCQSPPPKPIPYASPKKMNTAVGDNGGEVVVKKDEISTDVPPVDEEDPDERIVEQHYLQNWDPTPVLKELFGNVRPLPSPSQQSTDSNVSTIRMAGYMEKLPVKNYQKKASVFKSWKKRHFKAMSGKLFYYEDHRALQPLGSIDLVGCSVKCVDDKMLEVVEQSGRSLKLKCAFVKEAEDWKESLEAEAVTPAPVPSVDESSATEDLTIIIDLGSSVVKAGFAQEDAWPQVMFPCVIAVDKQNTENCKFGFDALLPETRRTSTLTFPLRKSLKIDKLKFDTLDLIGILEHVFNQLKVDPSKHKVIMTLPFGAGDQEKEELVELLLDQFGMEACYLQEQAILSMYSYSAISGIVVDIGNHIDIFPVVEGCMIESGTTRLPYGGRQITDSFTRMLTEKGLRLFSEVESYVSQAIKEKVSFVAKFTSTDDEPPVDTAMVVDLEKYSLADGTRNVTVDTARYRCTEGLFKPSVWGKDNPGIHELAVKAIMASGIDMRKQMCRNVYLSGGGFMSAGLAERLQAEVSALMPSTTHVQVHAGLERQHASYIGASVVAKLPLFEELCVSKEDWDELGPYALEKWSTL